MLTALLAFSLFVAPAPAQPQAAPSASQAAAAFDKGLPWTEYLAGTKQQHDVWVKNAGRDVSTALIDRLRKAGSGLKILVIAEDWCSDSVNSIPYLGTLAGKAGVEMRVITSEPGKPFMEAHRTPDGRAATPTVVLIRDGKEVAAWTERPSSLQTWFIDMAGKIDTTDRQQRKMSWYEWNRGDDALAEIVALAERTARVDDGLQPVARGPEGPRLHQN